MYTSSPSGVAVPALTGAAAPPAIDMNNLYGEKSSSVPMMNRSSIVNSAWWALPSGGSSTPSSSSNSG